MPLQYRGALSHLQISKDFDKPASVKNPDCHDRIGNHHTSNRLPNIPPELLTVRSGHDNAATGTQV